MKKLTKTATALACAALVAAGGLVQASASVVTYSKVKLTLTSTRTNTTTVTATTHYDASGADGVVYTPYARAYATVNGSKQYGTGKEKATSSVTDEVNVTVYISGGIPLSGYGGQHSIKITRFDPATGSFKHDPSPTYTTNH